MKQSLFMALVVATTTTLCVCFTLQGTPIQTEPDGTQVPLFKSEPTDLSTAPRTPSIVPFSAELFSSFIILSADSTMGVTEVSLISTAGDNYETAFDTADGNIVIPISGSTGYYLLTISMVSGAQYYGEFEL